MSVDRGEHPTETATRAGEAEAVEEAISAAFDMAGDWYCPKNPQTPRRECLGCVGGVAVAVAYPIIAEAVREQIAQAIDAETTGPDDENWRWWHHWSWHRGFTAGWNGRGDDDARLVRCGPDD